ncbi:NAD(P)/FAD-dependent oxidoreductase [Desulfosporosinus youngiae]|uniref:Flavoprotein, HI0933 family n=1 Tax=Desulfosporosinus youngiae DSM 17734 TaxID=768710 RepID=H5Y322_9FIRM|nr:NAD(P)/FAD-dependent oxidoreductase [Desulfosporosinus youngiae]EHQ88717.1 flavoprotein, HI0933 family [Desulfosporosinus youngiae DSM 17734]
MTSIKKRILIIGGGASGILAAITAARNGAEVILLERNPRIGKKLLATGNGRCNYTNVNVDVSCYHGHHPHFVKGVLGAFGVQETLDFFEQLGIVPKIEEFGKIFPMSGQASSILDVLMYELNEAGVSIVCNAYVRSIRKEKNRFILTFEDDTEITGDIVILAAGGKALPSSGSDGSSYSMARELGHTITELFPALVQLKLEGGFFRQIEGVKFFGTAEIIHKGKMLARNSGDILFANYGVSGPPILQISREAGKLLQEHQEVFLRLTILDSMNREELRNLLIKRFNFMPQKTIAFSLVGLVNKRLIPVILKEAGFTDIKRSVASLNVQEREKILEVLQDWRFLIRGTKSWPSAQVTAGGIDTKKINPETMESRIVKGLYFAGEIIDVDGLCGGFNLQWAWSSGYVAGKNAAI